MSDIANGMAKTFMAMGTIAVGSMTALATKSPVLAGTFARIGMETFKLGNTIARQLKPAFDSMVTVFSSFNEFLIENPNLLSTVASTTSEALGDISSAIQGEWGRISNIIPKTAGVSLGIKLGSRFGLTGMFAGAALGYAMSEFVTPETSSEEQEKYGVFAETMKSSQNTMDYFRNADSILRRDPSFSNFMAGMGQTGVGVGSGFITGTNAIFDSLEWLFKQFQDKEVELSTANGVS